MLIKGVTGGKEKGNPVEYSPEEKFPLAIQNFLKDAAPTGAMFIFKDAKIEKKTHSQKATNPASPFANNVYLASGKVWYKFLDVETDKMYPKESNFNIEFEDSKDHLGMPDLKLNKLELT